MKNIIVLITLVILWASNHQVLANKIAQISKVENIEYGTARYYAANLKGKLTSFGEVYDDSQLTASHAKFPLNTWLKVTNLENNLSVQVRVNDHCERVVETEIISLSKQAASTLGMIVSGKVNVKIEVVSQTTPEKTSDNQPSMGREVISKEDPEQIKIGSNLSVSAPTFSVNKTYDINGKEKSPKGFGVQVVALSSLNMVQDLYDELVKIGIKKEEIYVQVGEKDAEKIFRIMFGEFYAKETASEKITWLSQHGYKGIIRSHYNL